MNCYPGIASDNTLTVLVDPIELARRHDVVCSFPVKCNSPHSSRVESAVAALPPRAFYFVPSYITQIPPFFFYFIFIGSSNTACQTFSKLSTAARTSSRSPSSDSSIELDSSTFSFPFCPMFTPSKRAGRNTLPRRTTSPARSPDAQLATHAPHFIALPVVSLPGIISQPDTPSSRSSLVKRAKAVAVPDHNFDAASNNVDRTAPYYLTRYTFYLTSLFCHSLAFSSFFYGRLHFFSAYIF